MNCINSSSFSNLLKGTAHGNFTALRGIRQGDPLSPYIFILCIEPFIRQFNLLATSTKSNVGLLSSPGGFRISTLVFADDCLIFARATSVAARNITKLLDFFSKVYHQQVNLHKSTVFFSNNVTRSVKTHLSNLLQIQHKTTIGRHLGINNIVFCFFSLLGMREREGERERGRGE